jgi:fatty acid desaturase
MDSCFSSCIGFHFVSDFIAFSPKPAAAGTPLENRRRAALEMPTWFVVIAAYGGWGLLTWHYQSLPWWLVVPLGGWFVAWQSSLQHEIIHGHPTRSRWVNTLLAWPPLSLWLPFEIYRESHLNHHASDALTDPTLDPESFYVNADHWRRMGRLRRALLTAHNTLLGRLIIGPPRMALLFWRQSLTDVMEGRHRPTWALHLISVALVLTWTTAVCGIPVWAYALMFVYPGLALTLLRSFMEHRPAAEQAQRTVDVEGNPLIRLLFLNLNYHTTHHEKPGLPWYALPAAHRRKEGHRPPLTYAAILRHYLLSSKDSPAHPG